jgi:hypothetical protein
MARLENTLSKLEKICKILEKSSGLLRQPAILLTLALMVSARHKVRQEAETFNLNSAPSIFVNKNSKVIV